MINLEPLDSKFSSIINSSGTSFVGCEVGVVDADVNEDYRLELTVEEGGEKDACAWVRSTFEGQVSGYCWKVVIIA